jgi:hypothetical protein
LINPDASSDLGTIEHGNGGGVLYNTGLIVISMYTSRQQEKKECHITHITAPDGFNEHDKGIGLPFSSWA